MKLIRALKERYNEYCEGQETKAKIQREKNAIRKEQEIIDLKREAKYLKAKRQVDKLIEEPASKSKKSRPRKTTTYNSPFMSFTDLPDDNSPKKSPRKTTKSFEDKFNEVF